MRTVLTVLLVLATGGTCLADKRPVSRKAAKPPLPICNAKTPIGAACEWRGVDMLGLEPPSVAPLEPLRLSEPVSATTAPNPVPALRVTAAPVTQRDDDRAVRVTTNPDVVRGCTFLKNVETGVWGQLADSNRSSWQNERWLRKDTAQLGGNVVYVTSNDRTGASGEAYSCP
jgi:hypothetical protein